MREVQEDDMLLSRGANPRTGAISPHKLSLDDSAKENESVVSHQDIQGAQKWRQRGDQWISTRDRATEPDPEQNGGTPVSTLTNGLRVPQRVSGGFGQGHLPSRPRYHLATQAKQQLPKHPTRFQPETYDPLPQDTDASMRQKTALDLQKRMPPRRRADDDDLLPPPLVTRRQILPASNPRSSSAPTPRKHSRSMNNTDKILPTLPQANVRTPVVSPSSRAVEPLRTHVKHLQPTRDIQIDGGNGVARHRTLRVDKELPQIPSSNNNRPIDHHGPSSVIEVAIGEFKPQVGPATPKSRYVSAPQSNSAPHVSVNTGPHTFGTKGYRDDASPTRNKRLIRGADIPIYDNPPRQFLPFTESSGANGSRRTPIADRASSRVPAGSIVRENALTDNAETMEAGFSYSTQRIHESTPERHPDPRAGISRKCSRCEHSYVMNQSHDPLEPEMLSTNTARTVPNLTDRINPSEAVDQPQASFSSRMHSASTINEAPFATLDIRSKDGGTLPDQISMPKSESEVSDESTLIDEYENQTVVTSLTDHSICCKECCSSGCHSGCLGHLTSSGKPTMTPIADNRTEPMPIARLIGKGSSATAGGSDDNPTSYRMAAMAGGKNHELHQPPTKNDKLSIKKTRLCESGTSYSTSANVFGVNRTDEPEPTRHTPYDTRRGDTLTKTQNKSSDPMSANRKITPLTGWTKVTSIRKNVNGRNSRPINIPLIPEPTLSEYWDLIATPVAASRMWIQNNPQMTQAFWFTLQHYWKMMLEVRATSRIVLRMGREYSKHGKVKLKEDTDAAMLTRDCLRSTMYMFIMVMTIAVLVRLVKIVLLPFTVVVWILRCLSFGVRS